MLLLMAMALAGAPAEVEVMSLGAATIPERVKLSSASHGPQPIGNPGSWIGTDDYPEKAWADNAQGTSQFTLKLDGDGHITDCIITESSGNQELDDATCTLVIARARFEPAKDAQGNPTESRYSNRVNWQIPRSYPIVTGTAQADFDVGADGIPTSCMTTGTAGMSGAPDDLSKWCDNIVKRPYTLTPSTDGKVHPKHVVLRWTVETSDIKPPN